MWQNIGFFLHKRTKARFLPGKLSFFFSFYNQMAAVLKYIRGGNPYFFSMNLSHKSIIMIYH